MKYNEDNTYIFVKIKNDIYGLGLWKGCFCIMLIISL